MVTLLLDQTQLEIVLSPIERALALRKGSLRIERSAIRRVQLTDDPWTWLRGVRSPGTAIRGVLAMGTWRGSTGTDFVAIRGRRPHGVVIDLEGGQEFDRVVISTRHGVALAKALRIDELPEAADVARIGADAGGSSGEPASRPAKPSAKKRPVRVPSPRPAAPPAPAT